MSAMNKGCLTMSPILLESETSIRASVNPF